MDKKKIMLMLGALVVAIGTALAARSMLGGGAPAPAVQAALPPVIVAPKGPRVLVAQHALPVGTIITADSIKYLDWPKDMVDNAYFVDGKDDFNKLVGTVVRFPITAGQPLTRGALVAPGDRGFLAAALGAGMRAITITVSEKSGVAGFVFPGDHVDLMLTSTVKVSTNQGGNVSDNRDLFATETILKNLRVLATDQSTEQEANNGKTIVRTFHTVTLEVTPKIAEKIEVAQQGGALSLVLRSLADNQSDLDHAIADGSVKLADGATRADEARAMAKAKGKMGEADDRTGATLVGGRLTSGPIQQGSSFATAGQVSRFQRRNMPPSGNSQALAMARAAAAAHANEVHVIRGKDSQSIQMGANGQAIVGGAATFGSSAPASQGGGGPVMPTIPSPLGN